MKNVSKNFLYAAVLAGLGILAMPASPDFRSAIAGVMLGMGLMGYMLLAPRDGELAAAKEAESSGSSGA